MTETVFAWPGMGRLAIQSIYNRDYPVVQSTVFMAAALFIVINLTLDVLYGLLDPRARDVSQAVTAPATFAAAEPAGARAPAPGALAPGGGRGVRRAAGGRGHDRALAGPAQPGAGVAPRPADGRRRWRPPTARRIPWAPTTSAATSSRA